MRPSSVGERLAAREVHLWYAIPDEIHDHRLLNVYRSLLPQHEKDNILGMKGIEIQKGALLSRALVRTTLSRYTNCKVGPEALKFRKNRFGKPELEWQGERSWDQPSLHFNVSHSSSLVACAVAVDVQIGIDVEEKRRVLKTDILSFARRYFTSQEVDYLGSFPDSEAQRREFVKMWTLKEAYVKALGRGIFSVPLGEFSIGFVKSHKDAEKHTVSATDLPRIVVEPREASLHLTRNWQFTLLELARSHYASICIEKDDGCEDDEGKLLSLKVWKTVPLVTEELVSGTDEAVVIGG